MDERKNLSRRALCIVDGSGTVRLRPQSWADSLVLQCQLLAGHVVDDGTTTIPDLQALADLLPTSATAPERLFIRSVLSSVFGHVVVSTDVERRTEATESFLNWAVSNPTSDEWRGDALRLINSFAAVFLAEARLGTAAGNICVHRALRFIAAHYADANLALKDVAAEANLSPWHAARMLKQRTGSGFIAHLRQCRISEARRLLERTSLSVKEIAFAVGYGDSSHFGRDFKRLCGQAPVSFRRMQQETTMNSKN